MVKKKSAKQRRARLKQHGKDKAIENPPSNPTSRPISPNQPDPRGGSFPNQPNFDQIYGSSQERRQSEYSRSRRQSSLTPLTDRNLQTLLEQNRNQNSAHRFGLMALDMNRFVREQEFVNHEFQNSLSDHSHVSGESLEFGELNPPSEHSSDSTSLDDVCYLDYYDDDGESAGKGHNWPDLEVLEEFIREELEELQDNESEDNEVNFRYPVARRVLLTFPEGDEESPLLNQVKVNEADVKYPPMLKGQTRPMQPWEVSQLQIHPILNSGVKARADALCRFTYFSERLDKTIHSPTLAGLVTGTEKGSMPDEHHIRNSLRELFDPHYQSLHHRLPRAVTPNPESQMDGSNGRETHHSRHGSVPPAVSRSSAAPQNLKGSTPLGGASHASLSLAGNQSGGTTSVNSLSTSPHIHPDPFWLDILDPLEEEMKVIAKTFGLHPLTTEDIFMDEAREKVDMFKLYYFLCFTSFDIVYERRKQKAKEHEKMINKLQEYNNQTSKFSLEWLKKIFKKRDDLNLRLNKRSGSSSNMSKSKKVRHGELCPLNMYMIVFKHGVLTFHFSATPHPINVRRRARMLKDHLTVSPDWICYALIDDITDSFAPMIESIEAEVYLIEDEIMRMHSGDRDSTDDSDDSDDESVINFHEHRPRRTNDVFVRRHRSKSVIENPEPSKLDFLRLRKRDSRGDYISVESKRSAVSKSSTTTSTDLSRIVAWKRKGDMLRRIGECRKRVMSVMRLLSTKADVIKGYSKRFSESDVAIDNTPFINTRMASKHEILMYLGDIQDHIVTMVQSLNHFEKLLARSHSNYLAQINIDMTKVNNDTNDVLGKITVIGTIVLPVNVVTGLWGMNCIVPGQDAPGLTWFYGILFGIFLFSILSYLYAKKVYNL